MNDLCEDWLEIRSQFSSQHSIKFFKWMAGASRSATWQKELLRNTVHHPTVLTYPPPLSYSRFFLKHVIAQLEKDGIEVIDELYEAYGDLMSKEEFDGSFGFKSYVVDSTLYVVLKESKSFVSNGTTGLCTWQAAQYLGEWIAENKSIFYNKVVLELGSGLGLVGLLLSKMCEPKKMIFSDCHDEVIQCLVENIYRNWNLEENEQLSSNDLVCQDVENNEDGQSLKELEELVKYRSSKLTVLKFDWQTISEDILKFIGTDVDVIVAADVIYDSSIIPSFVRNLSCLLRCGKTSNNTQRMALICSTIRNSTTRDHFLSACQIAKLQYELMDPPTLKIFHYDRSTQIELIKFTE